MPKKPTKPKFPREKLEYKDGSMKKIEVKTKTRKATGWCILHEDSGNHVFTQALSLRRLWKSIGHNILPATLLIHEDKDK